MGNAAGSAEISQGREIKEITKTSLEHTGLQRQMSVPKLPMPPENELEECFNAALNTMNLPPDKVLILSQYDNEKKWELICDQKQFQVKNPPSTYLEKLKGCLDHGGVGRKFKRRVQEVTPVLRELEISLRTNHIGWAQEFLNEENQGLIVLVNYLSAAQSAVTCESETSENGALSSEKGKATDKLTEDQGSGSRDSPTNLGPKLSHGLTIKRAQRPSHIVQKDDIHLCIMCLRVIMNYQSGFNQVMKHPSCVNEIALSLNNRNPRTKALVLELLAAVCLVRGGHDITLSAFDNFKEVCGEKRRFEKLMEYFRKEESHINFTVACMQFINIVVHSVENLNFRVYLQYEFTQHGLDDYLDLLKFTESDRLLVQIQAYLDNVFDVAALLEDAETKNRLLEHIEQLQKLNTQLCSTLHETETGAVQNVIEVEKKIIQTRNDEDPLKLDQSRGENGCSVDLKELKLGVHALVEQGLLRLERSPSGQLVLQVVQQGPQTETVTDEKDADRTSSAFPTAAPEKLQPPPPPPPPPIGAAVQQTVEGLGNKQKKPIQTKYRMPLFNWDALKSDQVEGTIFSELDEQHVLQELDMEAFEEQFKTKGQSPPVDLWTLKKKTAHKTQSRVSLMEPNRAKNLAITLHKECLAVSDICSAIKMYNQEALSLDFLELLERFIPTEYEMKGIQTYESEGRPLGELSKEDLFMVQFGKIPRLSQRISTLTFMGNFPESVQNIQPHLNSIIAASMSVRTSVKLKKILEIILAFGNYMNSSKRGPAYGFRIQSLDLLPETKSTDRRRTLLHFIVGIIQEKYPELENFDTELHFLDKAVLVSFESILRDLGALEKGMELTRTEFSEEENAVLKTFLNTNAQVLDSLTANGKSAQDAYKSVVEYFGEDPKTTPPSNFFPIFIRFIKAYKQAEQDRSREQHREKKGPTCDDQSSSPKPEPPRNKVPAMYRQPHMDIIAELKRKQGSSLVREGQDGTIEDIITKLNDQPYRRTDATRHSAKEKPGQMLQVSSDISL